MHSYLQIIYSLAAEAQPHTHTWTVSPKLVRRWRKMTINLTHGLEAQGTEWALWSNDKIAGASLDAWPGKHHRRALRRNKAGPKEPHRGQQKRSTTRKSRGVLDLKPGPEGPRCGQQQRTRQE